MAEKNPIDIQKVIAQGTKTASLQDLQQQGFQNVKVLDEKAIQDLISRAIDRVVVTQTSEERQRILAQGRQELDRLMREQREMKSRSQLQETEKHELIEQIEKLQKEIGLIQDLQNETIRKSVQEATATVQKHLDEIRRRGQAAQQELTTAKAELEILRSEYERHEKEAEEAAAEVARLRAEGPRNSPEADKFGGTIAQLQGDLAREQEKSRGAAERERALLQGQIKEAQDKFEAGQKSVKQARDDYDRMNAQMIRLMGEVQALRSQNEKFKDELQKAKEAEAAAIAAADALGGDAGKWKYSTLRLPGDKPEIPTKSHGAWELVTIVREPDGTHVCLYRASK